MKATKILQVGELVLRQPARPVTPAELLTRETQELIALLRETMHAAPGVGLAAPQIGIPLQIAVIEDKPDYTRDAGREFLAERERQPVPYQVIVNPRIIDQGGATKEFFEGCLSLTGFTAVVPRSLEVTVECLDQHANPFTLEARGWHARILQHEIDHLAGTLYIDRMKTRTFMTLANFEHHHKGASMQQIRQAIGWD